jgi:two-component system response regulator FlrC
VAINCAAIPDGLLESELFGHERGAFTGAVQKKTGKFMAADTGTLLLDEIGEMSLPLQAKILRVLQERVLEPVGGNEPVEVDIRIIATTHRHLRKEVEDGKFREDLYYRLNVFPITLPPLRKRKADIPLLVRHFLGRGVETWRTQPASETCPGLSEEALDMLMSYEWRGNVRELENVMERAVLLSEGGMISPEHLILEGKSRTNDMSVSAMPASSLKEMEKTLILKILEESKGNRTHAAKALGIGLRTLRNKLREYRNIGA